MGVGAPTSLAPMHILIVKSKRTLQTCHGVAGSSNDFIISVNESYDNLCVLTGWIAITAPDPRINHSYNQGHRKEIFFW